MCDGTMPHYARPGLLLLALGVGVERVADAQAQVPVPTALQAKWMDEEIGGLITWGMNNPCTPQICPKDTHWKTTGVSMCGGCHWELNAVPPVSDFNPYLMNVSTWVEAAASFGAKYLVLAANHGVPQIPFPAPLQPRPAHDVTSESL